MRLVRRCGAAAAAAARISRECGDYRATNVVEGCLGAGAALVKKRRQIFEVRGRAAVVHFT